MLTDTDKGVIIMNGLPIRCDNPNRGVFKKL